MNICYAAAFMGIQLCDTQVISKDVEQAFIEHITDYGLSYGTTEEYNFRLSLFAQLDAEINEINADQENTFTVAHNDFSTWTKDEFNRLLGDIPDVEVHEPTILDDSNLEATVDWRKEGAVNPIKNQHKCGCCWAFSATATIEGHHFIATGKLQSFSEQELVDCDTASHGCEYGLKDKAMTYIKTHRQQLEYAYPYTGKDGNCKYNPDKGKVNVKKIHHVQAKSVSQLKAAIAKGPVSVSVEADHTVFKNYKTGVLNSNKCGTDTNHAVNAIGYGTTSSKGIDFYIVRNSWGTVFGNNGYIKIGIKSGAGICGIQKSPVWCTAD